MAGGVEVGVADTGVGIAPEDHAKVFEQFGQAGDTLTDKPRGTGLGLPICREIVEHHGGRLWLESAVGAGSTFSFTLPAGSSSPAPWNITRDDAGLRQFGRPLKRGTVSRVSPPVSIVMPTAREPGIETTRASCPGRIAVQ